MRMTPSILRRQFTRRGNLQRHRNFMSIAIDTIHIRSMIMTPCHGCTLSHPGGGSSNTCRTSAHSGLGSMSSDGGFLTISPKAVLDTAMRVASGVGSLRMNCTNSGSNSNEQEFVDHDERFLLRKTRWNRIKTNSSSPSSTGIINVPLPPR